MEALKSAAASARAAGIKAAALSSPPNNAAANKCPQPDKKKTTIPVKCKVYFDGSTLGNGTRAARSGAGAVVYMESGGGVHKAKKSIGNRTTNNQAEYFGLIIGLEAARDLGATHVEVYGDSLLAINQVTGKWRTNDLTLRDLRQRILTLAKHFVEVTYNHVPRAENSIADGLAREAASTPGAIGRHHHLEETIKLG